MEYVFFSAEQHLHYSHYNEWTDTFTMTISLNTNFIETILSVWSENVLVVPLYVVWEGPGSVSVTWEGPGVYPLWDLTLVED